MNSIDTGFGWFFIESLGNFLSASRTVLLRLRCFQRLRLDPDSSMISARVSSSILLTASNSFSPIAAMILKSTSVFACLLSSTRSRGRITELLTISVAAQPNVRNSNLITASAASGIAHTKRTLTRNKAGCQYLTLASRAPQATETALPEVAGHSAGAAAAASRGVLACFYRALSMSSRIAARCPLIDHTSFSLPLAMRLNSPAISIINCRPLTTSHLGRTSVKVAAVRISDYPTASKPTWSRRPTLLSPHSRDPITFAPVTRDNRIHLWTCRNWGSPCYDFAFSTLSPHCGHGSMSL